MKVTKQALEAILPRIEIVPIQRIKNNPNNPRTITEKKFKELVQSVGEFWKMLVLRPVIVDEDGVILGGNMRILAARKAGFTHIPIIQEQNLTEEEKRRFVIVDNNASGAWNTDDLANKWDAQELSSWGFSVQAFAPPTLDNYSDFDEPAGRVQKSRQPEAAANSFNVLIRAQTELERVQICELLNASGYLEDEHYFFV